MKYTRDKSRVYFASFRQVLMTSTRMSNVTLVPYIKNVPITELYGGAKKAYPYAKKAYKNIKAWEKKYKDIKTFRLQRKKQKRGPYRSLTLSSGLLPNKNRITLRYADSLAVSTSSDSNLYAVWKANGIYDPEHVLTTGVTGGNNIQPMFRDTMALLYENYQVVASSIKVQYINHDASNSDAVFLCLHIGKDADTKDILTPLVPGSTDELLMSAIPGYKYKLVGGSNNSLSRGTIYKKWTKRQFNNKKDRDNSLSVVNADPSDDNLQQFIVSLINGKDANSMEGRLYVTIKYEVEFSNIRNTLQMT